jgi:hypothetical protein
MAINFNTEPYYDDFDEDKKFYRILYRPGYAVQARELTQMQTILQNQVSRFGDHVFKEGAMVIPGQISVDTKVGYIKLEASYNSILASTVLPSILTGKTVTSSSGITAEVIHYVLAEGSEPATLYVRYKDSGDDNTTKTFANGEVIEDLDGNYQVQAINSDAIGIGSLCTIERGVYFVKKHFVMVEQQTIVLSKYDASPSYRIGLDASEEIITPEDDATLFDNAQNSFNYAAPGAHRYFIDLTLTKKALDDVDDADFIELVRIENGQTKKQITSTEYSVLSRELATRTYEESGNYSVKPFVIDVREYRDNNRGAYVSGRVYLIGDVVTNGGNTYVARNSGTSSSTTPPTHTSGSVYDGSGNTGIQWEYNEEPFYNRGINPPSTSESLSTQQANEAKLAVGLEPGTAYVQGYRIEKIATEYVTVEKSRDERDVDQSVVDYQIGNYVLVNNLNNLPPIEDYAEISLYDRLVSTDGTAPSGGTVIGTARVRNVEYHSGTKGNDTAVYKMFLFDVKMTGTYSFSKDVKGFYYNRSSDPQLSFTANVDGERTRLIGSATASSSTTITGTGTSFQTALAVGDYVDLGGTIRRVTAVSGQNSITVDQSTTVTGVTIDLVETKIYEPEKASLLFPIANYAVKTVTETSYSITQVITETAGSASGGTCQLSVTISSGDAAPVDADAYLVVYNDATSGGAVVNVAESDINVSGNNVTFTLDSAYAGESMKVMVTVDKDNLDSLSNKSKTLVAAATVEFTTQATAQETILDLGKADGYRLVSVKMKGGTFASPTGNYDNDITDRFVFDDGQRSTHYDTAKLVLKNSYSPPSAPIEVTFDYFSHGTGDYFTVDSYPNNVAYKQIPYYKGIPLRDCYDFRPRINDSGTAFTGTGASRSNPPKRGSTLRSDYTHYLARKTKVAVDFLGNFFNIDGEPSLTPGEPLDPTLGMVLYNLELEPYTFGTGRSSVIVDKVDNKRYTMRDIGKLEKRIDNLEAYSALNFLEQQTESLEVLDSSGDSRFKNGFIVDNFSGHKTGDVSNEDYLCSIDMENKELRPFFTQRNVNLIEKNSNDTQRASDNYNVYGDVITLPITSHTALISQPYASRLENINPFAVFTFLGNVKINPSSDEWFETDRRPDLIIDIEGNFASIQNIAERSGVLGTVWNSWETDWVGSSVRTTDRLTGGDNWANNRALNQGFNQISVAEMNERFGGSRNAPARQVVVETSATLVGQTRTGINTRLVERIDRQVVDDKVISTASIPYMRSRNILVQVSKLKPNTQFWPFFDNKDILDYCTPATKIVYTPSGATAAAKLNAHQAFDLEMNVGGLSTETERRIDDDSQVCLNKGDVITGSTSGATAVLVGKEYDSENGTYALYVMNVQGTFSSSETITGSVSGSTGTFTSITAKSQGDDLITNFAGEIQLLFNIPNTDAVRFRCGTREFKLVDTDSATGAWTSRGRTNYRAQGIIESKQRTVNSVRNAELVEEQVADNRVIVETNERVVSDTGWYDPLAQTFLIDSEGGAFLSKIDVFFSSKDTKVPVTMEIRDVVNGYPGKRVLPFSRVTLNPEDVQISENTVLLDGADVPSYDTATTFEFPSPVFVNNNTEYAFVLSSDSNNYKVWISQTGDTIPGSTRTISEQPYLGSLFKSQNASTWTPDDTQDIKFTVYCCEFDTSVIGNVAFVNDALSYDILEKNPFETRTGTNKVRVWHRNHGMVASSRVTIKYDGSNFHGLAASDIDATTFQISDVDLDSYVITVGSSNATADGYGGGSGVKATKNVQYDACHPIVQAQTFPETNTTFSVETISGKSVDSTSQTAYAQDTVATGVVANQNNYFVSPRMVASEINESNEIGGDKSLTFNVTMSTTNSRVSPILDTHRTSMVLINNRVNSPSETNTNVDSLDENTVISNSSNISITDNVISSSDSATKLLLKTLTVGKVINVTGATSGDDLVTVTAVASDGATVTCDANIDTMVGNITIVQREMWVDELAPSGSSTYSKYVTKAVRLTNPSNYVRVKYAGNIPSDSEIEVWYRTTPVGSNVSILELPYTQLTADSDIVNYENYTNSFVDVTHSADGVASFDSIQVKLVLKSVNSSAIPRIKDLRIIACA